MFSAGLNYLVIMAASDNLPIPLPQISLREEYDDWAFLYNPDTGNAVGLSPTGVTIWRALAEGKDLSGIIQTLSDEYEGLPEKPEDEIRSFCAEIVRLGYAHDSRLDDD